MRTNFGVVIAVVVLAIGSMLAYFSIDFMNRMADRPFETGSVFGQTVNAQDYPFASTTPDTTMLEPENFELTKELMNTIREAIPGIFVAKQCYTEMQSDNFTHQSICTSLLKQFNIMLADFNNQTRANVTQFMAEAGVQK